jgi:hypothetical protein
LDSKEKPDSRSIKKSYLSFLIIIPIMQYYLLYIDPGSGSMLIQMLLGVAVAVGVFFRKIKAFFLQLFNKKEKSSAIEEEN